MEDWEFFTTDDEESNVLRDIEVQSVGLVPMGANKRKFVLIKGGDSDVDPREIASTIVNDQEFLDAVAKALLSDGEGDVEKQDKDKARAEMALRILRASTVEQAIEALRQALGKATDEPKDEEEEEEEEQEAKAGKPEEYEEPDEEEEYPKPGASKSATEATQKSKEGFAEIPEQYTQLIEGLQQRVQASEALARQALEQLKAERVERRKQELREMAERYSALPDVEPETFADTLYRLEQADSELFGHITKVLDLATSAVRELYGELGSSQTDTENPFLKRVEAKAKELSEKGKMTYEEAYAEAYTLVAEEYPDLAWAFLNREVQ